MGGKGFYDLELLEKVTKQVIFALIIGGQKNDKGSDTGQKKDAILYQKSFKKGLKKQIK